MTVCVASMFLWVHGPDDVRPAIMLASDRMWGDASLGIEYEGSRQKAAYFENSRIALVSGDLTFASLALGEVYQSVSVNPARSTIDLVGRLSDAISRLSYQRSIKNVLAPLGIIPAQDQSVGSLSSLGLPDGLMELVAERLLHERVDVEFIVAGFDDKIAWLYHIDHRGVVTNHVDVGFLSIGNGGIHSTAYFMQLPYNHGVGFVQALRDTYFAKKRAEIAPGVGAITDVYYLTGDGINPLPELELKVLERVFQKYKRSTDRMLVKMNDEITRGGQQARDKLAAMDNLTPVASEIS